MKRDNVAFLGIQKSLKKYLVRNDQLKETSRVPLGSKITETSRVMVYTYLVARQSLRQISSFRFSNLRIFHQEKNLESTLYRVNSFFSGTQTPLDSPVDSPI